MSNLKEQFVPMPVSQHICRILAFYKRASVGKVCFFATAFLFVFSVISFSQSKQIDSLKKALPSLHDTARVDCLNKLGYAYMDLQEKDSTAYYADFAYEEAKKINYIHGIAVSFACKAQMAKHFDDDFIQSETFGKESLSWYEKTGNKEGIESLYAYLHYTVFAQSRFDEAVEYAKREYAFGIQNGDSTWALDAIRRMYATYRQNGDYEKSFLYAQELYEIALKIKDKLWISVALYHMAQLYKLIED